jgi:hypothetical protein
MTLVFNAGRVDLKAADVPIAAPLFFRQQKGRLDG